MAANLQLPIITVLFFFPFELWSISNLINNQYDSYQIWIDCSERSAVGFKYSSGVDLKNLKRYSSFYDDVLTPQNCEQTSRAPYKHHDSTAPKYDRGHLAAANHFDFSKKALKEANYMVNVLPQTVKLKRGAWKRTEELIECHRDKFSVYTIGGVLWGNDSTNDHFKLSHGIRTPDYYWRVIYGEVDGDTYFSAWILPNSADAKSANLIHYEISFKKLIREIPYPALRKELNKIPIKEGKPFVYTRECRIYES